MRPRLWLFCLLPVLLPLLSGCLPELRAPLRDWTFLVYLAADNNLDDPYAHRDLAEMEAVGSNGGLNVVVQYDTAEPGADTQRFLVVPGKLKTLARLGETNTGDPAVLRDFLVWAASRYPARHYALVLWDHGSGLYDPPAAGRLAAAGLSGGIHPQAVAFDDQARGDSLATREYAQAIREAEASAGFHLDLLDFDACLMQMVEVGAELAAADGRPSADFLVASEEVTPGDGNDYERILSWLAANPGAGGSELAAAMVDAFAETYGGYDTTISAIALAGEGWRSLLADLDELAGRILAADPAALSLIRTAAGQTRAYYYPEDKDLADFAELLAAALPGSPAAETASRVAARLRGESCVTRLASTGSLADGRSHGLAVLLPGTAAARLRYPDYASLRFAALTRWDQALALLAP